MPSRKLPNYLRTHRKRAGLSQDEIAFLLGCRCAAKVSRYERNRRLPCARTVFAYEVIFGAPARELFAGVFETTQKETGRRAVELHRKFQQLSQDPLTARKLAALKTMLGPSPEDSP